MNRLVAVVVALILWCGATWAGGDVSSWDMTNPGGGGLYSTADYDATHNGTPGWSLIGTDVGGLFWRAGDSGKWTPVGYLDGIYATHIRSVRFVGARNAVVGTDNGVYYSIDHGATWSPSSVDLNGNSYSPAMVTSGAGNPTTAVAACRGVANGLNEDSLRCYISFHANNTNYFAVSTDGGANFTEYSATLGGANDRVIKMIVEPQTHGTSQWIHALLGWTDDNAKPASGSPGVRAIYKSQNCATWTNVTDPDKTGIIGTNSSPPTTIKGADPIDIAVRSDGSARYIVSFENTEGSSNLGPVYTYDRGDNIWKRQQGDLDNSNGTTGAVWSDGTYYYVVAKADPDQVKDQQTDCPSTDYSCSATNHSGLWRTALGGGSPPADDSLGWTRIDNGTTWDKSWSNCVHARGQTNENMANTISNGNRHFWTSAQHVWRWDGYGYVAESALGVGVTGNEANSNRLDNAECIALGITNKDSVLAGFYDVGLWQKNTNGWISLNGGGGTGGMCADTAWTGDDFLGGNINGIATDGSDIYVTEAVSSKNEGTYPWRLWKRNPTTGVWTKYPAPNDGPTGDALRQESNVSAQVGTYLTGLCISGGTIYVTNNGRLEHASTSSPSSWTWDDTSAVGSSHLGKQIQVVAKHSSTLLVGGPGGIWRSTDGTNWSRKLDLSSLGGCNNSFSIANAHKLNWPGVHDIQIGADGTWWATVFVDPGCDNSPSKGLCHSTDDGVTWSYTSPQVDEYYAQRVVADSAGLRVTTTFSPDASGPTNRKDWLDYSKGIVTVRYNGSSWLRSDDIGWTDDVNVRLRQAVPVLTRQAACIDGVDLIYAGVSGNGVVQGQMHSSNPSSCGGGGCDDPNGCETERPPASARRPLEEAQAAPIEHRRAFTVNEARSLVLAGRLELYDVSGRRARDVTRPGLFFSIERNKAGVVTARHLVLVQR